MTRYKKGTVVLVLFPNSDLRTAKRRPALVVQDEALSTDVEQTIVAMITSNVLREGCPGRVRINRDTEQGKKAGLLTDSVLMMDNLATVRLFEVERMLGAVSDMDMVDNALRVTFGLR